MVATPEAQVHDNWPRLRRHYHEEVVPALMDGLGYANRFAVPRLIKVVVNMGVGEGAATFDVLERAQGELAIITGQHPAITRAKKAISNFKLRQGSPVGCKVTLRGNRMYEFLDRLMNNALPRIRDFQGVNERSFDRQGNYSLGLVEQHIFPEIRFDDVKRTQGLDVTIVTTANSARDAHALLAALGMPFRKRGKSS